MARTAPLCALAGSTATHPTQAPSRVYDGFTFHLLRHSAHSLMALAERGPAVASERLGHWTVARFSCAATGTTTRARSAPR